MGLVCLVACGVPQVAGVGVLSLDQLPGGFEGPQVVDITPTSAVVQFSGGVPTSCDVAYGNDETYGTLASDPMMGGGAVIDHAVYLTGLTPGTTYHYRITLTDQQARVYQSADATFTTAAAGTSWETEAPRGENIAASVGQIRGVSSNFGGVANDAQWGAHSAIDGDWGTEWSSNGDGDATWIEIDLTQMYHIHEIGFWTRAMADHTAQIFAFTVTTGQGEVAGPFQVPDAGQIYYFPVSLTAQVLRFDAVETNMGNTGVLEIEVYGTLEE